VNGLPAASGVTLVVIFLLFSGCASNQPQSINAETPVSTLQQELHRLEISKREGQQQLAGYLRIAELTSQRLDERQPAPDQAANDSQIATYNRAVAISLSVGPIKTGRRKFGMPEMTESPISSFRRRRIQLGHRVISHVSKTLGGLIAGVSGNLRIDPG
jgi:hypothetical protein